MKYCPDTTKEHPLSKKFPLHLEDINCIIKTESKGTITGPFNNGEIALKLDLVKKASNDEDVKSLQSMDIVLGMKDKNNNICSLLVDFKLNVEPHTRAKKGGALDVQLPIKSIKEKDYTGKIKGSKVLLFGSGVAIHDKYVFVFNDNVIQVAKRVISQILASASGVVLSIDDLKSNYF